MPPDAADLSTLRRALVIKLRHHGDVLLASPLLYALKRHAPHLEIDALVYEDTRDMLSLHPCLSELHTIDRNWKRLGPWQQALREWAAYRALAKRRYDLVVHLTEHPRGAWLARLLKPRVAVARRYGRSGFWNRSFTHLYPAPKATPRHTVELHLDALRRIGIYPAADERRLVLEPGAPARERVAALLREHGLATREFIHVHPTSRWLFKTWGNERVSALIDRLQSAGHAVVLTAAPEPREMAAIAAIKAGVGSNVIDLAGRLSLKELAALAERARLFVGVDSAPMHIAAAMRTPVVALFGPSGDKEWGPWMVPHRVVTSDHACRPCGNDGCGGGKVSECLTTIPVAQVLQAVEELLGSTQ